MYHIVRTNTKNCLLMTSLISVPSVYVLSQLYLLQAHFFLSPVMQQWNKHYQIQIVRSEYPCGSINLNPLAVRYTTEGFIAPGKGFRVWRYTILLLLIMLRRYINNVEIQHNSLSSPSTHIFHLLHYCNNTDHVYTTKGKIPAAAYLLSLFIIRSVMAVLKIN